jgi:hypothetical protein
MTKNKISKGFLCLFLFLFFSSFVFAIDNCKGSVFSSDDVPCYILYPYKDNCSGINATTNLNNVSIDNQTMLRYDPYFCYSLFNHTTLGTYTIGFDPVGDTADIVLEEGNKMIYLLYIVIILAIALMIFAYIRQDVNIAAISSFAMLAIGMYIIINGFSIYDNILTKVIGTVLIGLGAYILGRCAEVWFDF